MPAALAPVLPTWSVAGRVPYLRNAFAVGCAVVLAVVVIRYVEKTSKPSRLGDMTRTAFLRWRPQVQDLFNGVDVYKVHHYPNPPVMGLILRPFMAWPPIMGAVVWLLFKAGLTVLFVRWAVHLVRGEGSALPEVAVAGAVLLALHPILGDLSHGNVNLFIGFLVFAFLELFRRRLDLAAGMMLALAVACKVTPALFVPYLVWKRAWRSLAGVAVGLALWLAVVPGAAFGWGHNLDLLQSWFDEMVRPFVVDGKVTSEHANQSIPGMTVRLLTSEPSFLTYGDDGNGPPEAAAFHNLVDLGSDTARLLVKGFTALFALAVVLLCRCPVGRPEVPRAGPVFAAECSLLLLGMLLFSERTWKHHATTLVLPFLVLMAAVCATGTPPRMKSFLLSLLATTAGLLFVPGLFGGKIQDLAMVYGAYGLAYIFLTLGVVSVLALNRFAPTKIP